MTEGEKLIVALLNSKDTANLHLVEDEWLTKQETLVIRMVRNYVGRYEKYPPLSIVNDDCGSELENIRGLAFDHTLQNVKKRYVYKELSDKVPLALRDIKTDPKAALSELAKVVENLLSEDSGVIEDIFYHTDAAVRYEEYLDRVKSKGITHLSCGDPVLDDLLLGWGKTDLITLGGKPGSKKSWAALYLMLLTERCLPPEAGPVMFVSNEMGNKELVERVDCMQFQLPYNDFLRGQLNRGLRNAYQKGLEDVEVARSRMLFIYNCNTLQALEYKIKRYKPSFVILDGSYLLEPDMEEGMTKTVYITRKLKQLALRGLPILQTTQLRKNTGKKAKGTMYDAQEDFYYGSYIQDSDTAIRTYIPPDMIYRESVGWQLAKARKVDPNTKVEFSCSLRTMDFGFSKYEDDEDDTIHTPTTGSPIRSAAKEAEDDS